MKYITTLLLFVSLSVFSQSKTGTIDIDLIISQMPAFTQVQTGLEEYGKELDADLQLKIKDYEALFETYKTTEAGLSQEQKKEKQQTLLNTENDIANFKNNGVKLMQIKRDELLRPLYQEVGVALEAVAKAQQYTLIMQKNDSMVYIDPSTDVTRAVLTQLGITLKE
ncbi:outer membrane protein, ompH family [unidentified eubacterium SCB49]|nr:outer membrane protein, ompH family [unidentified eubacterium SCB49]